MQMVVSSYTGHILTQFRVLSATLHHGRCAKLQDYGFNLGGSVALVILDSTYPIGSLCFSPLGQEASGWKNSFDGKPRTLRLGLEKRQLPNRVLVCVFHVKCS